MAVTEGKGNGSSDLHSVHAVPCSAPSDDVSGSRLVFERRASSVKGILEILNAYNGGKLLLALYLVCLIYLWRYEKSRNQRLLLVWLPLFFLLRGAFSASGLS